MKNDRDNVTRQKKIEKNWIENRNGFLSFIFLQGFIVHALNHDQSYIFEHNMSFQNFHVMYACMHHTRHQVKCLNAKIISKG